ncbi:MAG: adenine deaminase [Trueperaceae bacterium]|nr:MAG: adenine deaminase [Trueperaceae bacterium]
MTAQPYPSLDELRRVVDVAAGRCEGDLLLRGGRLMNVFDGSIERADVLIAGALVAAVGDLGDASAAQVEDVSGAFVAPGLIDGHVHIESSLVTPARYAEAVLPRGVTGAVCDPHEIANVAGVAGVRWLLAGSRDLPFDVWVTVPSCVPSSALETAGAELGVGEIDDLLAEAWVVGVAELMSFPDVIAGAFEQLAKVAVADAQRKTTEGHAPGLSGRALQAYLAAGIGSDHESTALAEGREKLKAGAFLMVREGSVTRDLEALMPLVDPRHADRIGFVTDDRLPNDLLDEGGVDVLVRRAIEAGVDPVYAVRCASWNTANHYRLSRRGAVAPGYYADLAVIDDIAAWRAALVVRHGNVVARAGRLLAPMPEPRTDDASVLATVRLPPLTDEALRPSAPQRHGARVRVIRPIPGQIVTEALELTPRISGGRVVADPERDLALLACVERHGRGGGIGSGLVRGLGVRRGALGSSVGHDHHNLMLAGADVGDMRLAAERLAELGGGMVVVDAGRVLAELPLEVAGLVSSAPIDVVRGGLDAVEAAARDLGVDTAGVMMTLSFLGLAVIPSLRLTDLGLVDVAAACIVPFEVEA